MRYWIVALLLAAAAALVVAGVAQVSGPFGFVVAGLLLVGWTLVVFGAPVATPPAVAAPEDDE